MKTIIKLMKSRTFWTVLLLLAINVVQVYGRYLDANTLVLVNGILSSLAVYFKIKPSQEYK